MSDKNDGSIIISAKIDDTEYKKTLKSLEKLTDAFCNGTSKKFSRLAASIADYLSAESRTEAAVTRRIAIEQRLTSIMAARAVNEKAAQGMAHLAVLERQITATTALGAAQNKTTLSSKLFAAAQAGLGKLMKVGSGILKVFGPWVVALKAASMAVDYFPPGRAQARRWRSATAPPLTPCGINTHGLPRRRGARLERQATSPPPSGQRRRACATRN